MRALRRLFPFWLLNVLFFVLAATGLWTHWYPRFRDLGWGIPEMVHVALGWVCLPVLIGYHVHHLVKHWGEFSDFWRWNGLVATAIALVVMGTGVWMELRIDGGPPGWVRPLHFVTTFALYALLIGHTWRIWTTWVGAKLGRKKAS